MLLKDFEYEENGVFVCQECGTEYSVEEAKKLLTEVDENKETTIISVDDKKTDVSGKDKLIQLLYAWALNLSKMPDTSLWFNSKMNNDKFWIDTVKKSIHQRIKNYSFIAMWNTL